MSSANAPYPYFNGITYNSSFFSSSSSSSNGITQEQANSLYLRKTITDTATALETFSGGISSTTIQATGNISANSGLTLASGQYITTSHSGTVSAPTSTQVGGIINGSSISTTPPTSATISSIGSIALTAGTWVLSATRQYNNSQNTSRLNFSYGDTLRTSATQTSSDNKYGMVSVPFSNQINYANISAIVSLTASATVYLNVYIEYTTAPAIGNTNFLFSAVRIA